MTLGSKARWRYGLTCIANRSKLNAADALKFTKRIPNGKLPSALFLAAIQIILIFE
jgi:hypothetical protein